MLFRILTLIVLLLVPFTVQASSPTLTIIMPRGVQRGAQHELVFSGARLEETQQCLLYFDGVTVDKLEQVDANQVKVTITVAADCRLGEHVAQLRTASGITEFRSFFVGPFPSIAEVEPNNEVSAAQVVGFNSTVAGAIDGEDVDRFNVTATAGQRVSIEVEAIRLGTIFVDPFLSVTGPDGNVIAWQDDSLWLKQDCFVSFVAAADGNYQVLLRDASYGGNASSYYRLHVGNFARPTLAFPAGGPPGQVVPVEFIDVAGGSIKQDVTVPAIAPLRDWLVVTDEQGSSPSPVAFRVVNLPNLFDAEPNQDIETPTAVSVPCAVNGRLDVAGDIDWFVFEGKKDQVFDINVFARQIASPLDPILNVWGPDKNHIAGNDDGAGPDSYLRFAVPADGNYYFRILDHLSRGGSDFIYRVEISTVTPKLSVSIPRIDRYSQGLQQIFVPRGNRYATQLSATRGDFAGQIKLLENTLPAGIKMYHEPMAGNLTTMPVVFEATADAALGGGLLDFRAGHLDDSTGITGGFTNYGSFVLGEPNNTDYVRCVVDKLPIAVINPLPFRIEIVQPAAPIVRDGSMSLKVIAHRDEGFTAAINVQFPFRPPGIGAAGQVTIPEGQTEVIYPLDANANAEIGSWPVYTLGYADVNGTAWVSSQLAKLVIADRYVVVELQRAGCEQGQETQFVGTINHVTAFEGTATAELLGIPPNTEVGPIQFDQSTGQLSFIVKTKPETPVGKHTGVFCRVSIPVNGETVIATAGRSELQVDQPLPAEQAVVPPPPVPAERPLSRLEKLREAAKQAKEQKQ